MTDIEVRPADIPEWAAAVAEMERLTVAHDADPDDEVVASAWDVAARTLTETRDRLAEAIEDAIDLIVPEGVPEEPEAEDVLAGVHGGEQDGLEWGDYKGAGPVIAWRDADGAPQYRWWPSEYEIMEAIEASAAPALARRIAADLAESQGLQ